MLTLISLGHRLATVGTVLLLQDPVLLIKIEDHAIIIWSWRNKWGWFRTGRCKTFFSDWDFSCCSSRNMIMMFYRSVRNAVESKGIILSFLNESVVGFINPDSDPSTINLVHFQVCRIGCTSLPNVDKSVVFPSKADYF